MQSNSTNPEPQSADPVEAGLPLRRTFFRWLTFAAGGIAAALAGVPIIGYFFRTPEPAPPWIDLGAIKDFPTGETRSVTFDNPLRQPWDGITAHAGLFVRNQGVDENPRKQFLVLAMNCAHLGCPVSWFAESGLFMCPCHGGVYYADGQRASGPPPRGLFQCVWRVQSGRLEIQAPHYPTLQDTLRNDEKQT